MANNGSKLERLVAAIEGSLVPKGFKIEINERKYNQTGKQTAEFDVVVRGKIGSASIAWLIECRDRPSEGPQNSEWIQQLDGRRRLFQFNKITAVSTTGFAEPAEEAARQLDIDLRTLDALDAKALEWIEMKHVVYVKNVFSLKAARMNVADTESEERRTAALHLIREKGSHAAILCVAGSDKCVRPIDSYRYAVEHQPDVLNDVPDDGSPKQIHLQITYPDDNDHYVLNTAVGAVRVRTIDFYGEVRAERSLVPVSQAAQYTDAAAKDPVAQVVSFAFDVGTADLALEFHRVAETGVTHLVLRRV